MLVGVLYSAIICIFALYFIFAAYIKFTYPFWSRLNMDHSYGVINSLSRVGIISSLPLPKLKWLNKTNIKVIKHGRINDKSKEITAFIKKHQVMDRRTINLLTNEMFLTTFSSHNKACFVGTYHERNCNYTHNNPMIGLITARPLAVKIQNKFFTTYFIENLLIHREWKQETDKLAPELIYNVIFEQQQTGSSRTCLFERHGRLDIPTRTLLTHKAYFFSVKHWQSTKLLPAVYQITTIHAKNLTILKDGIDRLSRMFKCTILPCWSNIVDMISSKKLVINVVTYGDSMLSLYLMRDPCMMHNDQNVIECISSVNFSDDKNIFILGFNDILLSIRAKYKSVILHDLSHNRTLIDAITAKHPPCDTTTSHLFLYNFIQPSFNNSDFIVIN